MGTAKRVPTSPLSPSSRSHLHPHAHAHAHPHPHPQHPLLSAILHRLYALATSLLLFILALGPIPQHVGFVMDGNRRYARGRGKRGWEGHTDGFMSLRRTLEICLKLRIRAVSIYAFSIDNFSRSEEEVHALMQLARTKLLELCKHGDLLHQYGVKIRCIGRRELLPSDVLEAIEGMEAMTAENDSGVLNVCCPYTSRDEITTAVKRSIAQTASTEAQTKEPIGLGERDREADVGVYHHLETNRAIASLTEMQSPGSRRVGARAKGNSANCDYTGDLDIFVRTSDVKRLSDFMMWQSSTDTQLHFVRTMWPDFGFSDILPILLGWQQKVLLRRMGC